MTVAIVTDSGSDLTPAQLAEHSIRQVPLTVTFGDHAYLSPDELSPDEYWERMAKPDCPFPATAAPSPAAFKRVYEELLARGDDIVYVAISESLSATIRSGMMAKEMLNSDRIFVVDSRSASMGVGVLAIRAAEMANRGMAAADIANEIVKLRQRTKFFVALETLEYLRRGGRISGARAAIGGLLSTKPIMTIVEGEVVPLETPRTRAKARERLLEVMSTQPAEALNVLYTPPMDQDVFRDELLARLPGPAPEFVTAQIIGPVIGTHVGPGSYGGVLLYRE